jgi:hypothetical protein
MRQIKYAGALLSICVILLCVFAVAGQNQFGTANTYQVSFAEKVRIADTLVPQGNYEIRHVMEGENHIMVFRQVGVRKPIEVRAKCTLIALPQAAKDSQKIYIVNAANELVLHEMIFKGDRAKHVF